MAMRGKLRNRTGYLYKLGDGPINFDWNQRYCILDRETLTYYNHPTDRNSRGRLELKDANVSQLHLLKGHDYSFTVALASGKLYHFSHPDFSAAENWRQQLVDAAVADKVTYDEVYQEQLDLNQYEEAEVRKSRRVRRGSMGEVPVDMKNALERVQVANEDWKLVKVKNGIRVEALNWKEFELDLKDKGKRVALIIALYCLLTYLWLQEWMAVLLLLPMLLYEVKKYGLNPRFDAIRGSTLIEANSKDIFSVVLDLESRSLWDPQVPKASLIESLDSHTDHLYAEFALPSDSLLARLWKPRTLILKRYWMSDQNANYFVVAKSCPHPNAVVREGAIVADYFEGVVISPVDENRCLVTVTASVQLKGWETQLMREFISLQRALVLAGIREFTLSSLFDDQIPTELLPTLPSSSPVRSPPVKGEDRTAPLPHPSTILYNDGNRVSLEVRLPGYARDPRGGIKCINKQELDSQKGIILELIAKAGKQLMEGKNVVGVSLPVRIFEPRSTLERMVDWWCTAPKYLMAASLARDPLERFKQVITFAISGLYYGTRQLKPFNPVLGETYQGQFPDGAEIAIEHTSHHPPIAHFYVQGPQHLYIYKGHYEFGGKLKGNSVAGKQAGPNTIQFPDGGEIVFYKPLCKIRGLLFGDRVLEFCEDIRFQDLHNQFE